MMQYHTPWLCGSNVKDVHLHPQIRHILKLKCKGSISLLSDSLRSKHFLFFLLKMFFFVLSLPCLRFLYWSYIFSTLYMQSYQVVVVHKQSKSVTSAILHIILFNYAEYILKIQKMRWTLMGFQQDTGCWAVCARSLLLKSCDERNI